MRKRYFAIYFLFNIPILFFAFSVFSNTSFKGSKCYTTFKQKNSQQSWMSYEEAKEFIKSQGIKTSTEFRKWRQSGVRPVNFPSAPDVFYKEKWESWPEFLGKEWMSYEEAKEFIKAQGIRTFTEFRKWRQSGVRPVNFPSAPDVFYKEKWKSWPEFLGKEWLSYEEAKEFIKAQGIKTYTEFRKWRQSGVRPVNFPSAPDVFYKEKWKSWPNFLDKEWLSYEAAKEFIKTQGIRTYTEFCKWRQSGVRPVNFPSIPHVFYKEKWESWPDFLGKEWMSYEEAKEFIKAQGIRTYTEFRKWRQSGARPVNFPSAPDVFYKEKWKSWPDFLGREWMSYEEAKEFIKAQGIKTSTEFRKWRQSGVRPVNFPSAPDVFYKEKWESWPEFLGKEWLSYEEAKEFIKAQGIRTYTEFRKWRQSGARPVNFPSIPQFFYKEKWESWSDFLGTEGKRRNYKREE